jgi:heme exporter protein CcmD
MSHDFYLWMAYGVTALALAAEIVALRLRRARAQQLVEEERDLEAQD